MKIGLNNRVKHQKLYLLIKCRSVILSTEHFHNIRVNHQYEIEFMCMCVWYSYSRGSIILLRSTVIINFKPLPIPTQSLKWLPKDRIWARENIIIRQLPKVYILQVPPGFGITPYNTLHKWHLPSWFLFLDRIKGSLINCRKPSSNLYGPIDVHVFCSPAIHDWVVESSNTFIMPYNNNQVL